MRSSFSSAQSNSNHDVTTARPAWLWWGVAGGIAAILILSLLAVLLRGSAGVGRNRGPASEAAPDQQPSQDIDRSRAR